MMTVRDYRVLFAVCCLIWPVTGNGRMMVPPARNTMWRFGYSSPVNYDDSAVQCGSFRTLWYINRGRCGPCGDRWDLARPRPHETGGIYARNITVRAYAPGAVVDVIVEVVSNYGGWFEFTLCRRHLLETPETENCFLSMPVRLADGRYKYRVPRNGTGIFVLPVKLPEDVVCDHCVFRWQWYTGHHVGRCNDGRYRLGCGPQEVYRNCADIAIKDGAGIRSPFHPGYGPYAPGSVPKQHLDDHVE